MSKASIHSFESRVGLDPPLPLACSTSAIDVSMTTYRIGFLMYQLLGHITHDQRLRLEVAKDPEIQPKWMPILPQSEDRWQRLPVIKDNFTLLGGLRARDQFGRHTAWFNALYCHTQEPAVLLGKYMKRIPTILSMDATPINMDSIGHAYGHSVASKPIEHVKLFLIKRTFERAAHLVTFSRWA